MTRELILATLDHWGVSLDPLVVNGILDLTRDQPGDPQVLRLASDWYAQITYHDGEYTLLQGRTRQS